MFYEDLTPYEYQGYIDDKHLNIGWLGDNTNSFATGEIDQFLINNIFELCENSDNLKNRCMGVHVCPFCKESKGNGEIWIRSGDRVYIAPQMIGHYMKKHDYFPPQEFINSFYKNGKYIEPEIIKEKRIISVNRLNPQESLSGIFKEARIWLEGNKLYCETRWNHIEPYFIGEFVNNKLELEDKILFLKN